jgi:hypothetical protein
MQAAKWVVIGLLLVASIGGALWWRHSRNVEAELLAHAPWQVLARHEAAEYSRLLDLWREFKTGGRKETEFVRAANEAFTRVATRRMASASQESVLALMKDTLRKVKLLRAKSPEDCFRYFYPEVAGPPDVARILGPDEQQRTMELVAEVVRSSAESPVARPAQSEVEGPLAEIINATYATYGTDAQMVAHPEDPRIDRARVCEITTSLYERILALPPDTGTKVLRYMAPAP